MASHAARADRRSRPTALLRDLKQSPPDSRHRTSSSTRSCMRYAVGGSRLAWACSRVHVNPESDGTSSPAASRRRSSATSSARGDVAARQRVEARLKIVVDAGTEQTLERRAPARRTACRSGREPRRWHAARVARAREAQSERVFERYRHARDRRAPTRPRSQEATSELSITVASPRDRHRSVR